MQQIFKKMFNRNPDDIFMGDCFYHTDYGNIFDTVKTNVTPEEYYEFYLWFYKEHFMKNRVDITFESRFSPKSEFSYETIQNTIRKISVEGKPFIYICENFTDSFSSYISKINPSVPCLVSSEDEIAMKALREALEVTSSKNKLSVTSFSVNDIPIKDNSLQLITSNGGLSSSKDELWHPNETDMFCSSAGKEKAIHELYRILEPGGCLAVLEKNHECDYDPIKLYTEFCTYGQLFGAYTFDEIREVCNQLREEEWREKFENEGFIVEKEEKFYSLCDPDCVMIFLYYFTKQHGIHDFTSANWKEESNNLNSIPLPAHEGFDLFDTRSFLVLRKPY